MTILANMRLKFDSKNLVIGIFALYLPNYRPIDAEAIKYIGLSILNTIKKHTQNGLSVFFI